MPETEWTKEKVLDLLDRNDKAVWKAVHRIYQSQTAEEQAAEATFKQNGVGFNGADAWILTSFAKFYERTGFMTPKQTKLARKKIRKYISQLMTFINKN